MRGYGRRLGAAMCVVLVATGCGGSGRGLAGGRLAGTRITFSISVSEEEKPAVLALISRFENETKARVNLELLSRFRGQVGSRVDLVTSISSSALVERLRDDARTGKPTISLFAQDNLALKPLVDERLVQDLSAVPVPAAVSASMRPPKFDGKSYFLPFRPNVRLTYVDRSRLSSAGVRPPRTVEEFKRTAERLKALAGGPRVTLSLADGDPAAVTVSEWIVSFGGDPLVLNDRGSQLAFQFLQNLWKEGVLARESLFGKFDTEPAYLASGTTWVAQNWPITSAQLAKQGMLKRFAVYAGWSGPARAAHVIGGDVLGIPQGVTGKQKEAALALAGFLMSRESQQYLVQRNAWPSIRDDAYDRVPAEQAETFRAIRQALQDGWFRPSVSYWSDVTSAISEAVNRILLQYEPVKTVLDDLHRKVALAARAKGAAYPPTP